MNQWRRFQFFDTSEVVEEGSNSPIHISPKYDFNCCTSGHGRLIFGDNEGNIHLLERDFQPNSFAAFDKKVIKVQQQTSNNILLAVGEDSVNETVTLTQLKIWTLDRESSDGGPQLLRMQKIFPSKYPESPITAFAATEDMTQVAIGLQSGAIILFRGDLTRDRLKNRHTMLCPPREGPSGRPATVTNLNFQGQGKSAVLFVVTSEDVCSYFTGNRSDRQVVLNEALGADPRCAIVNATGDLVVGRKEAVYFYLSDECGPCYGLGGFKQCVVWFRAYLIVVSSDSQTGAASQLIVHDLKNKFIAYTQSFAEIKCVLCEFGSVFVVTGDYKVYQLKEKDTQTKLETLFKKNLYSVAISLANTQDYSYDRVIEIFQKYGDHLYAKGDYDAAMEQYISTIGTGCLEPSYVIRKFLDAQRTHNLTQYLQALHDKSLASRDHTTLLLNCYTKLKDTNALDVFIHDRSKQFDVETAVSVLRHASYYTHALELAKRNKHHSAYLQIMLDDLGSYSDALAYMWTLPYPDAAQAFVDHGKQVVKRLPERATGLAKELCTDYRQRASEDVNEADVDHTDTTVSSTLQSLMGFSSKDVFLCPSAAVATAAATTTTAAATTTTAAATTTTAAATTRSSRGRSDPRAFIQLFVTQPGWLMVFLEHMVQWAGPDTSETVFNTLLELYLRETIEGEEAVDPDVDVEKPLDALLDDVGAEGLRPCHDVTERRRRALTLLKNEHRHQYKDQHALFLCQIHNFKEGVLYLYERQGLHHEILSVHMRAHDHAKVIECCSARSDPNLWIQVLQYFALEAEGDCTAEIKQVLARIDQDNLIPPLRVVEILSRNPSVSLGVIKSYILGRLEQEHMEMMQDEEKVKAYREETTRMREEIKELKTTAKIFQNQKCADCTNPLKLPSCHFLCGHSYHQRCLADEPECPLCAPSNAKVIKVRSDMDRSSSQHVKFMDRLESSGDGFTTVAEYFGHGVF